MPSHFPKLGALTRGAIPALCFTEDDIREKFAQEEQWDELSEDEQRGAVRSLIDAREYDHAGAVANEAITEAVARYLHEAMLEKEEQKEGSEPCNCSLHHLSAGRNHFQR